MGQRQKKREEMDAPTDAEENAYIDRLAELDAPPRCRICGLMAEGDGPNCHLCGRAKE
jgi:hypothetical protein